MSLTRVAEKANVSVMTVSRVLNCKDSVSEATRQKVLAVSRELGIFPKNRGRRSAAHAGQADERRRVAVLVDTDISSFFLSELLVSLQRSLANLDFDCLVQTFTEEQSDFLRALSRIRPSVAAACLAVGQFSDDQVRGILNANPLCVFVDFTPSPMLDQPVNVVSYDNAAAARMAVAQLAACACKRILCIQGISSNHFSRTMREGYLLALGRSDFEKGCLVTADFTANGGYRAMKAVLDAGTPFDGLFTTDEMAFGAIRAMKERGLRIPEDVKVMGCDGMELGKELTPPLSTVILDRQVLSERAVARLLEVINSPQKVMERVLLAPRIEVRGTCIPSD